MSYLLRTTIFVGVTVFCGGKVAFADEVNPDLWGPSADTDTDTDTDSDSDTDTDTDTDTDLGLIQRGQMAGDVVRESFGVWEPENYLTKKRLGGLQLGAGLQGARPSFPEFSFDSEFNFYSPQYDEIKLVPRKDEQWAGAVHLQGGMALWGDSWVQENGVLVGRARTRNEFRWDTSLRGSSGKASLLVFASGQRKVSGLTRFVYGRTDLDQNGEVDGTETLSKKEVSLPGYRIPMGIHGTWIGESLVARLLVWTHFDGAVTGDVLGARSATERRLEGSDMGASGEVELHGNAHWHRLRITGRRNSWDSRASVLRNGEVPQTEELFMRPRLGLESSAVESECADGTASDRFPFIVNCPVDIYRHGGIGETESLRGNVGEFEWTGRWQWGAHRLRWQGTLTGGQGERLFGLSGGRRIVNEDSWRLVETGNGSAFPDFCPGARCRFVDTTTYRGNFLSWTGSLADEIWLSSNAYFLGGVHGSQFRSEIMREIHLAPFFEVGYLSNGWGEVRLSAHRQALPLSMESLLRVSHQPEFFVTAFDSETGDEEVYLEGGQSPKNATAVLPTQSVVTLHWQLRPTMTFLMEAGLRGRSVSRPFELEDVGGQPVLTVGDGQRDEQEIFFATEKRGPIGGRFFYRYHRVRGDVALGAHELDNTQSIVGSRRHNVGLWGWHTWPIGEQTSFQGALAFRWASPIRDSMVESQSLASADVRFAFHFHGDTSWSAYFDLLNVANRKNWVTVGNTSYRVLPPMARMGVLARF